MSFVRRALAGAPVGVAVADEASQLASFVDPGCAAALWRRQMPQDMQSWLNGLSPDTLPRGRITLQAADIPHAVAHLCDMSGLPEGPGRSWLQGDIAALATRFAGLMDSPYLRLRLDAIATNACRKFHVDAITARLVCTYRGTGTQYGLSQNGADLKRVFTVQTGSAILLRGTKWPARTPSTLLHRSPPIEGTGETRLVLVLDPVSGPDEGL